jgi:serine/threonine-protein kinase
MSDAMARLNEALSGRYHLERQLGEGGMATVYLARDLKHNRRVALKVLKPELAAVVGAGRFLAEIETTANLQHPHILPLFDSGHADRFLFYVMPYLEGESLRERLDREHQLPVDEAVRIATNVAEALDYAHRHGVVHRDIKPANILLQDGKPVVSDFGIALAVTAGGAGRLTETGLSLGTPHYMSPEQATGDQNVGAATDIWALACVLFEMLAGEPPYTGSTPQAVLGRIVTGAPTPLREQRRTVPVNVEATVARALEKVPADRFASAQAFAKALADPGFRHGEEAAGATSARRGLWNPLSVAMTASTVGLAAALMWLGLAPEAPTPVTRLELSLPEGVAMPAGGRTLDIAPDGTALVFVGGSPRRWSLWYRPLAQLEAVQIAGTERADGAAPRFSPDGRSVVYRAGADVYTVSLDGAPPQTLLPGGAARDLAWGSDGWIYFGNLEGGISRIPSAGGEPEVVTRVAEGEISHAAPDVLPDGRGVLFTRNITSAGEQEVALATPDGQVRTLMAGRSPRYVPTGHVVFAAGEAQLLAVAFDTGALEVTSSPVELVDNLFVASGGSGRMGRYALSDNGVLVYAVGTSANQLTWVDRDGRFVPVDPDQPLELYNNRTLALSPDNRRLVVGIPAGAPDLWVKDLPDGPLMPLTRGDGQDRTPVWSRDGRTITYSWWLSDQVGEIRRLPADGSSEGMYEVVLERVAGEVQYTRDGRYMIFRDGNSTDGDPASRAGDIGYLDLATGVVQENIIPSTSIERSVSLSPDDRLLAYVSNQSGTDEVYVRPWPDVSSYRVPVSTDGGAEPLWAHNGRELFYREPSSGSMMVATYALDPTFRIISRERLFDASAYLSTTGPWRAYDVTSDDQRFVMIRTQPGTESAPLIVVHNFDEGLRRLLPN